MCKELFNEIFEYVSSKNPQELNVENWYQELLHKNARDEMEENVFTFMDFLRNENLKKEEHLIKFPPMYFDWDTHRILCWEYLFKLLYFSRNLAVDDIENYQVSTVWLGLTHAVNHVSRPQDPPLIFETMIFVIDASKPYVKELNGWQQRYSCKEEAIAGHQEAIKYVKESVS